MNSKKVLVSGCYDLLHGGHIAFFKTASAYGNLYVSVGRDENLLLLKGKETRIFGRRAIVCCKINKIRLRRLPGFGNRDARF